MGSDAVLAARPVLRSRGRIHPRHRHRAGAARPLGWSSTFIWVGITAIGAGATLGGIGVKALAKKRIDALAAQDPELAAAAERRAVPIEYFLTGVVLVTVVAMVHKWGA